MCRPSGSSCSSASGPCWASSSSSVGPSRCSSTRCGKRPSSTAPKPRTTHRVGEPGDEARPRARGRAARSGRWPCRAAGPWPRAPRAGARPRPGTPRSGGRRRSGAARCGPGASSSPSCRPHVGRGRRCASHGGGAATSCHSSSAAARTCELSGPIGWSDGFTTRNPSGAPTASTTVAAAAATMRGSVRWGDGRRRRRRGRGRRRRAGAWGGRRGAGRRRAVPSPRATRQSGFTERQQFLTLRLSGAACDPGRDHGERPSLAALVAFAVAAALTPLAARFARRLGVVDELKEIGLARQATPLLGGLAIFGGALVAGLLFLPDNQRTEGILAGRGADHDRRRARRRLRPAPGGQARRADRGGGRAGHQRRRGGRVHVPVRAPRRARRPRRRR